LTNILLCILLLAFVPLTEAQEFSGDINGRLTDGTGAVLSGVAITLKSLVIQRERTAISDEGGHYRFTLLPPGTYSLTYELTGFKTLVRDRVIVEVGKTYSLNIELEVATAAEVLTVTGESPVVDVQNATVGVTFNQSMLRNMPNARDIWAVLASTPGVETTRFDVGGATAGSETSYRSYGFFGQNQINLDGVITTEGTTDAGFYMDYGAFAEIGISGAANSAEVQSPGVFINTVVKTGGNDINGEVYVDWEDPKFQATNLTEELQARGLLVGDAFTRYNDFNVNSGGPFIRDRFWWFGSYRDQFIGLHTNLNQNASVPSSATVNPFAAGPTGGDFTTRLQNYTVKFNYQLNAANSLVFSGQTGRKFQPHRGGSESGAKDYVVESTGYQNSWSWAHKTQWISLINNRTTLEASINNFGYHVPQVQQPGTSITPRFDPATNARRGSYQMPNRNQRRRWHWNANMSYFRDNLIRGRHDFKIGYGFIWEDQRLTQKGAPGSPGDPGHVVLRYLSGVPDEIRTTNTPFKSQNSLYQHFVFAQDTWQIGRRLTATIGLRWDRYLNWYPEQINEGTGPFAQRLTVPRADVALFNNFAPRFSFVYDIFGNTRTALKLNWGRFYENTSHDIAGAVNPVTTITNRYDWNGVWPLSAARITALPALELGRLSAPVPVDPNLRNAYTDEYVAGVEHQLAADFGVNISFVRKVQHNLYGTINRAYATTDYTRVQAIDNGPDGLVGTDDDRRITIFERIAAVRPDDLFLTNLKRGGHFSTIELGARKRMSNNWQLITGWDWTKRNTAAPNSRDPNVLVYSGNEHYATWSYKLLGTYTLPYGFEVSGIYNAQKGEAYGRQTQFNGIARNILAGDGGVRLTNLRQGSLTLATEPAGTRFLPTVHLTNLRIQKNFRLIDTHNVDAMFDLFNIGNAHTVLGVETLSNTTVDRLGMSVARFGRPQSILNPRIFRLGLRYNF